MDRTLLLQAPILAAYAFVTFRFAPRDHDGTWVLLWAILVLLCSWFHALLLFRRAARKQRKSRREARPYRRAGYFVLIAAPLVCLVTWSLI